MILSTAFVERFTWGVPNENGFLPVAMLYSTPHESGVESMSCGKIVIGLMVAILVAAGHHQALSQQFPYAAPQAPEFDERGNLRAPAQSDEEPAPRPSTPPVRNRERADTQPVPQYGVVTPHAPEVAAPSPPAHRPQQQRPAPNYQSARPPMPQQPPAQIPDRPDCSQFPMMIARARSEPEMQMTARQYLTCLLKSGWGMEQARDHVIRTIESTYRLAR